MTKQISRRAFMKLAGIGTVGAVLAACQPKTVVVEKEVEKLVTQIVEVEKEVTKIVAGTPIVETVVETKVVEVEKEVEKVVTATPVPTGPVEIIYGAYSFVPEKQTAIMEMFNKEHPDIHVTAQFAAWDGYWTKLQTMFAGGEAFGDVFMGSFHINIKLALRNMMVDLDPFVDADGFPLENFYSHAVRNCRWQLGNLAAGQGHLFALPFNNQTADAFYFNKTIFDDEGIDYPDESWTWDTLLEVAKQLTTPDRWGMMQPGGLLWRLGQTYIWQAGGAVFDEPEFTKSLINSSEAREALQYLADLILVYKVAPPPGTFPQFDPFTTGQVAMGYAGQWQSMGIYKDITDFDWDIAYLPKHPGTGLRTIDAGNEDTFNVNARSKNPRAAWELMKYLTAGPGGEVWCQEINAGFAYRPTAEKYTYTKDRTDPPLSFYKLSEMFEEHGHAKLTFGGITECSAVGGEEWSKVQLGEQSVEDCVTRLEEAFNEILTEARKEYGLA